MIQPTPADYAWMMVAIELAHQCPPSAGAFSVGAVIVDQNGEEISRGYRETDGQVHAEESALTKLATDDPRLPAATIYSTWNPARNENRDRVPAPNSFSKREFRELSWPGESPVSSSRIAKAMSCSPMLAWRWWKLPT